MAFSVHTGNAFIFTERVLQCVRMNAKVIRKDEIVHAGASVEQNVKKAVLLSGDWDGKYAVAVVVVDCSKPKAEVHEHAADVWRVMKGSGKFILGGEMQNPEKIREGEWTADEISGGEIVEVGEGDLIDIPAGVPHQIDARGGRLELQIVKINS